MFRHADKVVLFDANCLKKSEILKKSGYGWPRLVAVICSLNCFEIDLICWQLVSVKATKRWLSLLF